MPFKSKAQMRLFYAKAARGEMDPETVKQWQDETPNPKKLPEKLKTKPKRMIKEGQRFVETFEKFIGRANNPILKEIKDVKKNRSAVHADDGMKAFELEGQKMDNDALAGKSN